MTWNGDDLGFAWMTQRLPVFGATIPDPERMAAALSLSPAAVAGTGLPVQIVSCGVPFLYVPLTTRMAVDSVVVDAKGLAAVFAEASMPPHGVFVFSAEPGDTRATVYSRMFAPELGITEDPATGSASGPLGCYLVKYKVVQPDKSESMISFQGAKMGRPSHVHIAIGLDQDLISSVRVGGKAVLAGEGTLYIT
jgi:trans-2,3-dihydro-3-hydroxyanthranilate isomerase